MTQSKEDPGQYVTNIRGDPGQYVTNTRRDPGQYVTNTRGDPGQYVTNIRGDPGQYVTNIGGGGGGSLGSWLLAVTTLAVSLASLPDCLYLCIMVASKYWIQQRCGIGPLCISQLYIGNHPSERDPEDQTWLNFTN